MQPSFGDQVILVNDLDQEIGVMDKVEAHRGMAKLHRAISVFLFNDRGELLIQQRSHHKIVGAGQWANTCCGNLRPGESYDECAKRRLKEELGIESVELQPIFKFQYAVQCNESFSEREMDQVYGGKFNGRPNPNPSEVQAWRWVSSDLDSISNLRLDLAPWFTLMLNDYQVLQKL